MFPYHPCFSRFDTFDPMKYHNSISDQSYRIISLDLRIDDKQDMKLFPVPAQLRSVDFLSCKQ